MPGQIGKAWGAPRLPVLPILSSILLLRLPVIHLFDAKSFLTATGGSRFKSEHARQNRKLTQNIYSLDVRTSHHSTHYFTTITSAAMASDSGVKWHGRGGHISPRTMDRLPSSRPFRNDVAPRCRY